MTFNELLRLEKYFLSLFTQYCSIVKKIYPEASGRKGEYKYFQTTTKQFNKYDESGENVLKHQN